MVIQKTGVKEKKGQPKKAKKKAPAIKKKKKAVEDI